MMPSIAGRSASVSARAAAGARIRAAAAPAVKSRGCQSDRMKYLRIMISILPEFRRFEVNDIVSSEPSGRALRETRAGASGELAGGAKVAVVEGGLGGGERGIGLVAFAAIGDGELAQPQRGIGLALQRHQELADRLLGVLRVARLHQGLAQQHADQRRAAR